MADSKNVEGAGRTAGAVTGGVLYLLLLKVLPPNTWYSETLLLISPVITLLCSNFSRLFRRVLTILNDYVLSRVREWVRDRKRYRIEQKAMNILNNSTNKKEVDKVEMLLMQTRLKDLEKDITEFDKL